MPSHGAPEPDATASPLMSLERVLVLVVLVLLILILADRLAII